MKPYIFTFLFLLLLARNLYGQNCDKAAAISFLQSVFKNGQYIDGDSTIFRGFNKDLTLIKTPLLNKLLPEYCFYTTFFISQHYEYREVETALLFSNDNSQKALFVHSPLFRAESRDFIRFFYGLKLSDQSQRVELAREVVTIFSEITYKGRISKLINLADPNVVSFELWHGDLSWRIYDFYFDDTHQLIQIKIFNGVKRDDIWEGYKRQ